MIKDAFCNAYKISLLNQRISTNGQHSLTINNVPIKISTVFTFWKVSRVLHLICVEWVGRNSTPETLKDKRFFFVFEDEQMRCHGEWIYIIVTSVWREVYAKYEYDIMQFTYFRAAKNLIHTFVCCFWYHSQYLNNKRWHSDLQMPHFTDFYIEDLAFTWFLKRFLILFFL